MVPFDSTDVKLQLSPPTMAAVVPKMCLQQPDAQVSDDTVRLHFQQPAKLAGLRSASHPPYPLIRLLTMYFPPSVKCFEYMFGGISHCPGFPL